MRKTIVFLAACLAALVLTSFSLHAETVESEKEYYPLDLVVVVDSSGSMRSSDANRTALAAVRMLVNMMPADDSRVGIISFNTEPSVLTKNNNGENGLIPLEDFSGVERIREAVNSIQYEGDTGIGNALFAATDLLDKTSNENHTRAIVFLGDGVNDFGNGPFSASNLAACDENEAKAIKWAKDNGCYIYCVGYDYLTAAGSSSMGAGGEGLVKFQNMASATGGRFQVVNSVDEIEQLFIDFLADVCDLNYKEISTIPGDGGLHECKISINPSVVEANIRIAGGEAGAIQNGEIRLFDPSGKEVQIANSNNVRFDIDATSFSIKVILPKAGDWLLTVNGIYGEDIHIGLLEHFKMDLTSQLIFPKDNPPNVAYSNDTIGIKTWLTYDGEPLDDEAVYDAVSSAEATFVSRANRDDVKVVNLTREGLAFTGSFVVPEDSFYDITIRLDWDTVYREDNTLQIWSSNKPLYKVQDIENVSVNKNKTISIQNLYSYVKDDENDSISAEVSFVSNPEAVDVSLDSHKGVLEITGKKWSASNVTIQYTDKQGNTVDLEFGVKAKDPVTIALLIGAGVLLLAIIVLILILLYRKTLQIRGDIRVALIEDRDMERGQVKRSEVIYEDRHRSWKDPSRQRPVMSGLESDIFGSGNTFGGDSGGFGTGFGFGATSDGFGDSSGGWGTASSNGFGSGNGLGTESDSFSWGSSSEENKGFGGFASTEKGMDPWAGNSDASGWETSVETKTDAAKVDLITPEEQEQHDSFNSGSMKLPSIAIKGKRNLYAVLERFVQNYTNHMTMSGTRNSILGQKVADYIKYHFAAFSEMKIEGSRFGRNGIKVSLPKAGGVEFLSPRPHKGVVNTKESGRNLVIFKIQVPYGDEEDGIVKNAYIEIEYINK